MTIGIAVSGPLAGLAAFSALSAVERVGRGDIGGFVSFVAISEEGGLLTADTQRGGTAMLFGAKGTPPQAFASARLAALISSGPDRPEPLMQFTPADAAVGMVTGHRLPNTPGADGRPLNLAVLARLQQGETPRQAVEAVLAVNPEADAGLIALARDGSLFAADSALVSRRSDRGSALAEDARAGARCAVLHNSIFPAAPFPGAPFPGAPFPGAPLASLAATVAFDVMAPADGPAASL